MTNSVLVVEDDAHVRDALGQTLELEGYDTELASSFIIAKDHIAPEFDGVILSDIRMPGRDGLYLLEFVQSVDPEIPVILLTGEGDIPMAISAIKNGAFDFLEKPCGNDVLLDAVARALKARHLVLENRRLRSQINQSDAASRMIYGISELAESLRGQIRRVAKLNDAVLITGAPGSGIAKVAEATHLVSHRSQGAFSRLAGVGLTPGSLGESISVNAAGSIFIDEFGSMPGETQFALLNHIDSGVGPRILVGRSVEPEDDDGPGQLHADLYYRLDALRITIPPLRHRPEDIPVIFREYVRQVSEQANTSAPEITPDVVASLMAQDWPGNSRALMNAAMRFVFGLERPSEGVGLGLAEKVAQVERTLIIDALTENQGNASATAMQLKLPRKTFYDKLAKHRISPEDFR